ncbi:hypothetical protein QWY14_11660 [Planococcus sp. N028]|uniref:ABC transporter permease n=1 Tax=Planococcus shixiaomingii TaxID=3058393 RepID=A0ABT8N3L3_9BACL|nr:hypothetical protein [Planococcus sp. N028]MDN7242460.1 hypothetical protein [Planococcus sp. N028]
MREFYTLRFLRVFKSVFATLGVDYEAMEKILQIKLTMDERRVPTLFNDGREKKKGNHFLKSLWIYALYGLILIPFFLFGENYMVQMSIVFGMILFILMTSMISDFSSVLLDVRDKNILQTKPLNKKTINAAKVMHIMIYMGFLTGAFAAIPLLVSFYTKGILFTLIFLAGLFLGMLFIVVLTSLLYLFVLKFFDGERLKDVINYVQILLSVSVLVGYQLIARTFQFAEMDILYAFSWWHLLMPPVWFAAPFELLLNQNNSTAVIALSLLALCIPLLAIYCYSRLMPSFERNLEKLLSDMKIKKQKRHLLDEVWARLACFTKEERVFFRFALVMMKKEREFKLKVYPTLGISLVFPFVFLLNNLYGLTLAEISGGNMFLLLYFSNLMIPLVVTMLKFSGNHKGSWLFKAAPIPRTAAAYSGALKAFLIKLYLPVFLILSASFLWIFTSRIVPDLVAILLAGIAQTLITYKVVNDEDFPFSKSFEFVQDGGTAKLLLLNLIIGGFALVHWISLNFNYGVYLYIAALLISVVIGWRLTFPPLRKRGVGKLKTAANQGS